MPLSVPSINRPLPMLHEIPPFVGNRWMKIYERPFEQRCHHKIKWNVYKRVRHEVCRSQVRSVFFAWFHFFMLLQKEICLQRFRRCIVPFFCVVFWLSRLLSALIECAPKCKL